MVRPYRLAVEPDTGSPGPAAALEPLPPLQPVVVGSPFRLVGARLSTRSEPVRVFLSYHDDEGGDWIPLGSGELKGDRLETQIFTIPEVLEVLGNRRAAVVPGTYLLVVTSDQRPLQVYYTLSIELLPLPELRER